MMNVLILANPFSGSGPNRKIVGRLEAALRSRGLSVDTVWKPDERIAALEQLEGDQTVVVAAGGDGSIADVVNDMNAAGRLHLRFATLPVGTENLLAQAFGFTCEAEPMAAAIARGETRAMDLVRIESAASGDAGHPAGALDPADDVDAGPEAADHADHADHAYRDVPDAAEDPRETPPVDRLFTLMASSGFDAEVIHRLDRWRKSGAPDELRRVDRRSYVKRIIEAIRGYGYPAVTLVADGREITGHQAYVFNLPKYGGGLAFAPEARADDGQLDWVVFERPGFWRLLGYHWLVMRGKHRQGKTVAHGRASDIMLRRGGGAAVPTQADGDPAGQAPLNLTLWPSALRVIRV